jgi:hypothetical protein
MLHLRDNPGERRQMAKIPDNQNTLLRRDQVAAALTEAGFPISKATLATKASRGNSPPYRCFGRIPLYRWGDALAWAEARMTSPRHSTSEADAVG